MIKHVGEEGSDWRPVSTEVGGVEGVCVSSCVMSGGIRNGCAIEL